MEKRSQIFPSIIFCMLYDLRFNFFQRKFYTLIIVLTLMVLKIEFASNKASEKEDMRSSI